MQKFFMLIFCMISLSFSLAICAEDAYDLDEIPMDFLDSYYDDQVSTSDAAVLPREDEELRADDLNRLNENLDSYPEFNESLDEESL